MYYEIKDKLTEALLEDCLNSKGGYVAVLSAKDWEANREKFAMGIELDIMQEKNITKAEVNYDSLTGSFSIPSREKISDEKTTFYFALDEKGIVFIDDGNFVQDMLSKIQQLKKWRMPSLERFIYDFIELILKPDLEILEGYEEQLEKLERDILEGVNKNVVTQLNDIRGDLLDLRTHYVQFIDFVQELLENENQFFASDNLRYFKLLISRMERYRDQVLSLREYSMQIRDLYQSQIDIRQNKIMTVLTVITTIFFPLSIVTGWYGMNFKYMPELELRYAYPILVLICMIIILIELIVFKKKKYLE